jgi:transposase-like protein
MNRCPHCQANERQVKTGRNRGGSQRYQCQQCQRSYTPQPTTNGYERAIRQQAIRLYLEGNNLRRIGRILCVNHQSVANWINAYHATLPTSQEPVVTTPETVELDEVFTFIGSKKQEHTS